VKYLLLLCLILLTGCETTKHSGKVEYTKLTVTDVSGDLISEWLAEGKVTKVEQGYEINAVERRSGPPYPTTSHYPNGRKATVVGPNIVLEVVDKPAWLHQLDGWSE
jgi:hypothetical protein